MEDEGVSTPSEVCSGSESQKNAGENVHLKVLVPSIAAGAIIGRGGEAIAQIQKETAAKVKMAKQNDFYPGTTERVCLIVGAIDGVLAVHKYVMTHIREKKDSFLPTSSTGIGGGMGVVTGGGSGAGANGAQTLVLSSHEMRQHGDRSQQVKILVPNTTAGMIIGKGGAYIKEIKQKSGAFIQISQKAKDVNLLERCITVAGDLEQCHSAMKLIVCKIAEDPQSSSCPNTSYAEISGPIASAFPTGSPYAQRTSLIGTTGSNSTVVGGGTATGGAGGPLAVTTPLSLGTALMASTGSTISPTTHYLALQGGSPPTILLNNPIGNFSSSMKLLSPSESLNYASVNTSVAGNTTVGHAAGGTFLPSGMSIGMTNLSGLTATAQHHHHQQHSQHHPQSHPHQTIFSDVYNNSPMASGGPTSLFAYNTAAASHHHPISATLYHPTRPTLTSPIGISQNQQQQQFHSQPQQQHHPNQATFHATFSGPSPHGTTTIYGGIPSTHHPGFSGLPYALPSQKPAPSAILSTTTTQQQQMETIKRDLQVPDSLVAIVAEAQSEMQRKYGVSIRIHHYQSGVLDGGAGTTTTTATSSSLLLSEEKTRVITISGTQQGVQGALTRIHELLALQQSHAIAASSSSTNSNNTATTTASASSTTATIGTAAAADLSSHKRDGGGGNNNNNGSASASSVVVPTTTSNSST